MQGFRMLSTLPDSFLLAATQGEDPLPGAIALATDRDADIYEGAAGLRRLGDAAPMTGDSAATRDECAMERAEDSLSEKPRTVALPATTRAEAHFRLAWVGHIDTRHGGITWGSHGEEDTWVWL